MKRRYIWVVVGLVAAVVVAGGVAFWEYHKQPQFCATCHIMEPYLQSWTDPGLEAYAHAQHEVACLDCHEPTLEQQIHELVVFVRGDYSDPLEMQRYEDDACFDCHLDHEHASYEEIIRRTEDYVVDGRQINPHNPHEGSDGPSPEEFSCYQCHKMHRDSPLIERCYGCHHERELVSCSECH